MKIIILIIVWCVFLGQVSAASEQITIVGKIRFQDNAVKVFRSLEGDSIQGMFVDQKLTENISGLKPGEDIVIKGYVTLAPISIEGQSHSSSVFVIESVKAISLKDLGKIEKLTLKDYQFELNRSESFSPLVIPVSTELASAVTLTTSLLLLQSLTARSSDIDTKKQIDSGLIIFAGAMATGIFIFDQMMNSYNKGTKDE